MDDAQSVAILLKRAQELSVQRRITGLLAECRLIEAQIATYLSGDHREFDLLPDASKIDVTDLFVAHLRDILAAKQKFVRILEARRAEGA
jgi:hypothetical protein